MLSRHFGYSILLTSALLASDASAAGPATLFQENQKFQPSDNEHYDVFGASVTVSGNIAIIGAPRGGVNVPNSGSAYVYERSGAGLWIQTAELSATDANPGKYFGTVDLDGNLAVIGAADDATQGFQAGAAYVFERSATGSWTQIAKLLANDGGITNHFGASVAISDGQIVVGAFGNDAAASDAGAAYIFKRDLRGQWGQTAKLTASNAVNYGQFGVDVDIDGDRVVVGSPDFGVGANRSGGAYVFEQSTLGSWTETSRLMSNEPEHLDQFGLSVSIDGSTIAVGSPRTRRGADHAGAAFLFDRSMTGEWTRTQRIEVDYFANGYGDFGRNVAVSGMRVLIGAEDHNLAGGWNGAAYLYEKDPGSGVWSAESRMVGTGSFDGRFGSAVALDGQSAFVGAWRVQFESGLAYYYKIGATIPEPSTGHLALLVTPCLAAFICRRRNANG